LIRHPDEGAPSSRDSRADRPRAVPQPGRAPPAAPPARLRRDAGDDLARYPRSRPREARGRRRLPAAGRRHGGSGDGAHRARARRGRVPQTGRSRPAARRHPHRHRPGAAARDRARPRAAGRSGRHDRGRRHDPRGRARGARRRRVGEAAEGLHRRMKRILLAYSRSLDGADAIPWLADRYSAEVVTLTLDFGQGRVLEALRDCALAAGASRAHVLDVAAAFASEFTVPALRAGALYTNGKAAINALGRMAVAQKLVEVAAIEQTTTVAHGGGTDDR